MMRRVTGSFFVSVLLIQPWHAAGQWQTHAFDLTKNDGNSFSTNVPASAFGDQGILLTVKDKTYTFMSKKAFRGDTSFDLRFEIGVEVGLFKYFCRTLNKVGSIPSAINRRDTFSISSSFCRSI